ncbi:hypothetical protein GWO09_30705 [candidate division KSB1 bacterium]|nr:hypothetical protein [candidate division KSB1 bacterium]
MAFLLLFDVRLSFPQSRKSQFKLPSVELNYDILNSQQNQDASIVLTRLPRGMFLNGDETDKFIIKWEPEIPCTFRYSPRPSSRNLADYPTTISAKGTGQLTLNPAKEGMGTAVYYCILVSEEDPSVTSVEFQIIVQANKVARAIEPIGSIDVSQGAPLFRWDPVEGVPYYFLFLSEGPLSIDRNDEGEVTGLTGLNLTWQILTPSTFMKFGDPDPTDNFVNADVPPLIPGIEYNWIVLNSYGPTTDLVSGEVAPVGPSFFEVSRSELSQAPSLVSPASGETIAEDEILFEWSPVPDVSRYRVFLYEAGEFADNEVEFTFWSQVTSDTKLTLKANKLLVKTQYFWRVIAENADGISASERLPFQYDGSAGWIKFIVNSEEGPLSRVAVEIRNELDGSLLLPAVTDTLGISKMPLPTGNYTYIVSRPGFVTPPPTRFTVPNNDTGVVNIQLSRGATTVSGQIVDPGGEPVFDAKIELTSGDRVESTRSEASGYFSLAVAPGRWTMRTYKAGFAASDFQTIDAEEEVALDIGQVTLQPATNSISGQATFVDGQPLSGAFVRAQKEDIVFETTTGNQGGYRFQLGPGPWKITLDAKGFFASPPDYTFELSQGQQQVAGFVLSQGGLVYGKISFQGVGLENAVVQAFDKQTGELLQKAVSNIHGNYSLGLPAGDFELRVVSQNFLELRRDVSILEGETLVENFALTEAGFVEGTVINLETALPVEEARVFVVEDTTIQTLSDVNGKYFLSLPPDTAFQIDASFPGFGSNGPFSVSTASGETVSQDFLLKPLSGIIRGRVTDGFAPIEGAVVHFEELDLQILTESNGQFEVEIAPGLYNIEISKECHFSNTQTVNLEAGETVNLDIPLQALESVITGKVSDESGNPIVGADISAVSDTTFATQSTASGDYELCLNGGIFRVSASRVGYLPADTTLVISDGDSLSGINFVLKDNFATLTGTVQDDENNPVISAVVTVTNAEQTLRDTTDSEGSFQIEKIIPGEATIQPSKSGLFGEKISFFFLAQQSVDLNLTLYPANGFIRGTVRDQDDNSGIADVLVSAQLSENSEQLFSSRTDASGQYSITELPVILDKTYQVFAFKEGFFSPGPITDVPPNTEGVDFLLVNKSGTMSGVVQDVDTNEPLENARVEATNRSGGRSIGFSDSLGTFILTELVPNEMYDVTAAKSGYFANRIQNVTPGDTNVVVKLLRRYGFVMGSLTDFMDNFPLQGVPVQATPNGSEGRQVETLTDTNGQYMLRLIADNYKVQPIISHNRSEPAFVQLNVSEVDTVEGIDFKLEPQMVQSISLVRTDLSQQPTISNQEMHCYTANARDVDNRPVNIGTPKWTLNVSRHAAVIDSTGCVRLSPNYFGDLTITATDVQSGVAGNLSVQVFATIDSTTNTDLFDDRGLQLGVSENAVQSRKNLLIVKEPIAPAKRGRAEILTADSTFILKPAGLTFKGRSSIRLSQNGREVVAVNSSIRLQLPAPPNTEGQQRFIAKWDEVANEWIFFATDERGANILETRILETGEYVALAISKALTIENFSLRPNPFSPFQNIEGQAGLKIEFDIASSAAPNPLLTIKIYNLEGNLVRLLHDQTPFLRGHSKIYWDGKTDNGTLARNGRYLVRMILEDPEDRKEEMKSVVLIK